MRKKPTPEHTPKPTPVPVFVWQKQAILANIVKFKEKRGFFGLIVWANNRKIQRKKYVVYFQQYTLYYWLSTLYE